MDPNSHIGDDDLESYSMRGPSGETAACVERHLLVCETCRLRLMEVEEYLAAIKQAARDLPHEERHGPRRHWSIPRLIGALALLALAAVTSRLAFRRTPAPFPVKLQTQPGRARQTTAPSRRPLLLELDLTGLAASSLYRIEMVDASGDSVWRSAFGALNGPGATASITVPAQKRGTYFVRVALPSGETPRVYGLEIRGTD